MDEFEQNKIYKSWKKRGVIVFCLSGVLLGSVVENAYLLNNTKPVKIEYKKPLDKSQVKFAVEELRRIKDMWDGKITPSIEGRPNAVYDQYDIRKIQNSYFEAYPLEVRQAAAEIVDK